MASEVLFHLALANLAGAAAILVVLMLRGQARAKFGAGLAYVLWLAVPVAMLASFLPPRIVWAPASLLTPHPNFALARAALAATPMPDHPALDIAQVMVGVWLAGAAASLILLAIGQRRALARFGPITADAQDRRLGRAANPSVGPALVGVFRPRIIVPKDFEARFEAVERAMILAHERTHLACGHAPINALAALVKAVNWFNPLIHVAARCARVDQELACDAAVVGRHPASRQTYAEALLKTQLAYVSLPLGCDWPVRSASLLEKRIEMLVQHKPGRLRLLGGAVLVAALAAGSGLAAWAAEPADVRIATSPAGAPSDIDRYAGAYEVTHFVSMIVTRQGDTLALQQQQGPPAEQFRRGSDGVWTGVDSGRQVTFDLGPDGRVVDLAFAGGPVPGKMRRLPDGAVDTRGTELASKLKTQAPDGRTEGVIRELIRSVRDGGIDFDARFGERMAIAARAEFPEMQSDFKTMGELKTLAFKGVGPGGGDIYEADFANGRRVFRVLLDAQGRIDAMSMQPI